MFWLLTLPFRMAFGLFFGLLFLPFLVFRLVFKLTFGLLMLPFMLLFGVLGLIAGGLALASAALVPLLMLGLVIACVAKLVTPRAATPMRF